MSAEIPDPGEPYAGNNALDKTIVEKECIGKPEIILMASGSEVHLALEAGRELETDGFKARVVSFPSWELFDAQPEEYKERIIPPKVKARISIEAGVSQGWERFVGPRGVCISVEKYGASAPAGTLFREYGFTK